jgi:GGDEF domain-containing protein
MPQRSLTVLTADPKVRAACEAAVATVPQAVSSVTFFDGCEALEAAGPDGLVVIDPRCVPSHAVHEWSLGFLRQHRALVFLLTLGDADDGEGLARFVGAQGALAIPVDPAALAERLASPFGVSLPTQGRELPEIDQSALEANLGAKLTAILGGDENGGEEFVQSITDPETGLYVFDYWEHRLEEEFKRSNRFRFPLGLAAFRIDGMIAEERLLDVASIILLDTRDVDVVTRFDHHTFLALLPHTGPEGVRLFSERVRAGLQELGLQDLAGEQVEWLTATAVSPDATLATARELLHRVIVDPAHI